MMLAASLSGSLKVKGNLPMRFKFTPTLVVTVVLACAGGATAASVVTGRQSKDGSVTSAGIKNGSVGLQDAPGPAALADVQVVESAPVDIPAGSYASIRANCPSGKTVIGTGFYNSITDPGFVKAYGTFVGGIFFNNTSITVTGIHVQAICASGTSALSSQSESLAFERDVRQLTEQWQLKKLDAR